MPLVMLYKIMLKKLFISQRILVRQIFEIIEKAFFIMTAKEKLLRKFFFFGWKSYNL